MKRFTLAAFAAIATTSAFAQVNGFKIENLWHNSTGTFTTTGAFPTIQMKCQNQNNTANNTYGERFVAWLSADGGATIANIDGHKDFSLFFTMKMHLDAAATREIEGGLLMNYDNHRGFTPTSQFYAKFDPQGVPVNTITTSGDWVMPSYNFVAHDGSIADNETVLVGIEYDYNDANPSQSMQRLTFKDIQSPWLNGNWGGAVYDPTMQLGIYFQPLVEAGNATHTSTDDIHLVSFTGSLVSAQQTKAPASYTVTQGFRFSGDLASLAASDNNKLVLFPDDTSLTAEVVITSEATTNTNSHHIVVTCEQSVSRPGLAVVLALKNNTSGDFDDFFSDDAPLADLSTDLVALDPKYISASGQIAVRATWSPINDEVPAQDGWGHSVDYVSYKIDP